MARRHIIFHDPPPVQFMFGSTKTAWFWLLVRLYVGWAWLEAGWDKTHSALWVGDKAGVALSGFIQNALTKTTGPHPDVQAWYAWFLTHAVLPNVSVWSHVIAWGELAVGIGLILGMLTGVAAFFGAFMNLNFLMAGSVSVNPALGVLSIGLVMAWKVAGYLGVDRWLLPNIAMSWRPGHILHGK